MSIPVSDTKLELLKCSFCNNYVSHLSIYAGKVSCARCPVLLDEQPVRSRATEVIVSLTNFLCVNKKFGCIETKTAVDMPLHEQYCIYKQYLCPMAVLGPCSWQGYIGNLILHYELHHSIYLLKSADIKLKLLINFEHNYLIKHEEELFILHTKFDPERKLTCSLRHISKIKNDENFYYTVTLCDAAKLIRLNFNTLKIEDNSVITLDHYELKILKNPEEVFCEIRISSDHDSTQTIEAVLSSEVTLHTIRPSGTSKLKCSSCNMYMDVGIYKCNSKHDLCFRCTSREMRCPICSSNVTPLRNTGLEKLINYSCQYTKNGCTTFARSEELLKHEEECRWKTRKCPLNNFNLCLWKGQKEQLLKHIANYHTDNLFKSEELIWCKAARKVFIVPFDEEVFIFTYRFYNSIFYCNLKMNGSAAEAEKYAFELSFLNSNSKEVEICVMRCVGYVAEERDPFKIDNFCIKISLTRVAHLISNQKLVYTLSVIRM